MGFTFRILRGWGIWPPTRTAFPDGDTGSDRSGRETRNGGGVGDGDGVCDGSTKAVVGAGSGSSPSRTPVIAVWAKSWVRDQVAQKPTTEIRPQSAREASDTSFVPMPDGPRGAKAAAATAVTKETARSAIGPKRR